MKYFLLLFCLIQTVLLLGQDKPVLVVSSGHHQTLMCVDISPNGKHVASGGADNLVKIYDMQLQQELNTFTGHSSQIEKVQFSPNGNYIFSSSRNELIVHTHPQGKFVKRMALNLGDDYQFYISKENILYFAQEDEPLKAYSLPKGELIKEYPGMELSGFLILPDEKTLVSTTRTEDNTAGVGFFSFPEGKLLEFVPVEGLFYSRYDCSADGRHIIFERKVCEAVVMDVKTKELKSSVTAGVGMMNVMKLSPNGKEIITSTFDNYVRYWDVNSGKKLREIPDLSPEEGGISMSMAIKDMDFSDDGKLAVFCYSDLSVGKQLYTVEWFNAKTMKSMGKHQGETKLSLSISIDESGKILSTGTIDGAMGIKCLDISKGNQKAFMPGIAYHGQGGNYLASSSVNMDGDGQNLDIYKLPSVRKVRTITVHGFGEISMSTSGEFVTMVDVTPPEKGDYTGTTSNAIMRIWETESGKERVHLVRELMDMPRACLFNLKEDTAYILYPKRIEIVDMASGKVVQTTEADVNYAFKSALSPDGKMIISGDTDGIFGTNVFTGEKKLLIEFDELTSPMSVVMSPDKSILAVSALCFMSEKPNQILVYDWATKSLMCELKGHTTVIGQLVVGYDNKHIYSSDYNGVIAMWKLRNCKAKASFLAFGAEDYLINTPEGYYKSSKGNMAKVGFRQKGKLYTFDQFDLRYNRPDKVLESIGIASSTQISMYRKAYKKRLSRMGFTEEQFGEVVNAPEIEFVNSESLPLNTSNDVVEINLKANDDKFNLDRLSISVNAVPIYGKLGKSLKNSKSGSYEGKIKIPLVQGVNKIQASVMNEQGIESVRVSYSVECKKAVAKPNLYVVAYGVKEYQDSTMNLTYSDKDAQDLVALLQKNSGESGHYGKVSVELLTNGEVLKEKLADAKSLLESSKVDDQVIMFYSGHGLLDENMDYYLSTHDVDFVSPKERGLRFDDFKDLIDGIPARNRLMLIDACHSGEVDKDEVQHVAATETDENTKVSAKGFAPKGKKVVGLGNTFELMKELFVELRKESGATIIASSSGKEFSLESDDWKNGVFTFALKEGLIQMKADSNSDKKVSVSELKSYLFDRVKELTNGKQTPTVRRENLQHDCIIY